MSNLQSLTQLLEEESNAPYYALQDDTGAHAGKGLNTQKSAFDAVEPPPWDSEEEEEDAVNSALQEDKESAIVARLLKDLVRTSKRSWNRYKKGGRRSCFGVRLERIGAFSGLSC
ncbi:hypothetical protein NHX12_013190 [Muraenolepis orangiensis]|uniref:Uncharacterized protein n=1 Tax=Muraenolepis orangiensis TaxID=630683 RepID=A0A9Q0I6N5_9TELE|nr:hypothetical protein NHX12_013190 [Muraenolepis orangiensis]